jgi:outer membrane lipoprotein-sorting protein
MRRSAFLFILIIATWFVPTYAGDLTALEIVNKADDVRGAKNWGFSLQIVDYEREGNQVKIVSTNGYRVTAKTFGAYPNEVYDCVSFFLSPKEVEGQKFLKQGQIYWQFFPGTSNIVRISAAQRMAGQVSAADIASSNYANDYDPKLLGEETLTISGKVIPCYKLEMNQKNEDVAYWKLIYWVAKETFEPIKVEHYAVSDKLLKTAYYRDMKMAMGRLKPHEIFIVDPLKPSHITRMLYSNLKEEQMPDHFFQKNNLESVELPK